MILNVDRLKTNLAKFVLLAQTQTMIGISPTVIKTNIKKARQQFEAIQIQIKDKENKLSMIDNKYQPKISEYESKLLANDFAKNKIVSTIETVKQGINQNIK